VADEQDPFDRRVSEVLAAEESDLGEYAERLIATGSLSIERPSGTVTAQFRGPAARYRGVLTWQWRPELSIVAATAGDEPRRSGARGPTAARYRDRAGLIDEIVLTLAMQIAWLDDES
jgi:hypothetical protein